MRIGLGICVLFCVAIAGFGVHQVLEQQRQVTAYSAKTTAVVLERRLEGHWTGHGYGASRGTYVSEAVLKFRYEVQGQQFTSNSVFPGGPREGAGGYLGERFALAVLERFQIGEETTAHYNPANPMEACLIRRPSFIPYLIVLLPTIVASGILAYLWRSSQRQAIGRRIAAPWHVVGLAGTGHYVYLAGADHAGGALVLLGVYTQLGLIPVAFAMPDSKSSEFARRIKSAIGCSLFGTFVGIWLGLAVGWAARAFFSASATVSLSCWGYGIAIPAALLFLLGLFMKEWEPRGRRGRGKSRKKKASRQRRPRRSDRQRDDEFVPMPPPDGPIPYQIDQRPVPSGEDLEILLPDQVGPFRCADMDDPDDVRNAQIYAEYRCDKGEMFSDAGKIAVELGVCDDPASAQRGVETSMAETLAEYPDAAQLLSLKTEPSFFKTLTPRGAFMSWTRGCYYFSAHAPYGEEGLDRFMEAFPY